MVTQGSLCTAQPFMGNALACDRRLMQVYVINARRLPTPSRE